MARLLKLQAFFFTTKDTNDTKENTKDVVNWVAMPKQVLSPSAQVTQHIKGLSPQIQPALEYLRQIILSISNDIAEHIKWNSPAFYYTGEMKAFDAKEYKRDMLVMNLRKDRIMCVLPTGMKIKKHTKILEGTYTDGRRMITFTDLADILQKENELRSALKEWLTLVDE